MIKRLLKYLLPVRARVFAKRVYGRYFLPFREPGYLRNQVQMSVLFLKFIVSHRGDKWRYPPPSPAHKKILVLSGWTNPLRLVELILVKALQYSGFTPVVITRRGNWAPKFYSWAGINQIIYWEDYFSDNQGKDPYQHVEELSRMTLAEVLAIEYKETNVGLHAATSALRKRRDGFNPSEEENWKTLSKQLFKAKNFTDASQKILETISPDTLMLAERGYVTNGSLYDLSLKSGLDVLQWVIGHKDNALIFKRHNPEYPKKHPITLSEKTWRKVRQMSWGSENVKLLESELLRCYESGEWFGEVGTQFNKSIYSREDLIAKLKLSPNKKTAVVFAHIFWDASFINGKDIYADYRDWFVETIRAACDNSDINWLIKVHPANIVKNIQEGFFHELAEERVLRETIGELPDHVKVIPANSDVNTFSLFSLMDYCLTVRGTIGIEAASFGIPVITAGTGRYDRMGFTFDSDSVQEYLSRLANIQEIGPLPLKQRELAQRFAYAIFLMRPMLAESFSLEFLKDTMATLKVSVNIDSLSELLNAKDMKAFVQWVKSPGQEDFVYPILD